MSIVPGQPRSVLGVAISRSIAAPAVTILKVEPGGNWPMVASGPVCVGGRILGHGEDLAGGRFDHHDHGLFAGDALTAFCAAFCTARSRLMVHRRRGVARDLVEYVDVDAVLVDGDDAPPGVAVEVVGDGLLDLVDHRGREIVVGGHHFGLRGDHHTGQRAQGTRDRVVVGLPQRDQAQRSRRRTGQLGHPLRIQGVVEAAQRIGDRVGRWA